MIVDLGAPASSRAEVARRMKDAFDRLEFVDSGWWYVDFDHPVLGRDRGGGTAERVPGNVITSTDEPPANADVVIVAVGFEDPYTGEVHLGNLFTVPAGPDYDRNPRDEDGGTDYPNQRLPALALFVQDGKLMGMTGTIHSTREANFETAGTWPELDQAIAEWAQLTAAEVASPSGR